jgi:DNA-3-methyladenine glycosylase II
LKNWQTYAALYFMKHKKFIGVKTTRIYCLPSCPAKAPLSKNIVYFETPRQAERDGFRPCKRCFPDFPPGKWIDNGASVILTPPKEFDFIQCLKFLARSFKEPCHSVAEDNLFKLLKIDHKPIVLKIHKSDKNNLCIDFLTPRPKKSIRAMVAKYVWQWFDLETNLKPFYRMAKEDPILKHIAKKFYGLRILVIHDLFEALCWAIIGQQINLEFAYTLKQRFVETFGEKFFYEEKIFYLFPTPQSISQQAVTDLKGLQFTGKKSEYIIELARKITNEELTKNALRNDDHFETARKKLIALRGVGKWTVDYVCLRCLKDPTAFPVDDIGLQNAVKQQLGLNEKPTVDSTLRYAAGWENWQAYAAFYLWRSLI